MRNTEVGVRVGVRDRLGEAIGKPVADLHGCLGQGVVESIEKRPKRPSSGFQQSDRSFSRHAKVRPRTPESTENKTPSKKIAVFSLFPFKYYIYIHGIK